MLSPCIGRQISLPERHVLMSKPGESGIALIGAGALAQELLELFSAADARFFSACYAEPEFTTGARIGLPLISDLSALRKKARYFVLGLAAPQDRVRITYQLTAAGLEPAHPLIMPTAIVSPTASLAPGTLIGHGVQVGSRCRIGAHNLLMHHVVFGHDTTTGEHVILNSGVYVAGYVTLHDKVVINANATLTKGIVVGENAFIAPGAVCFRSVPESATAVGNPARFFAGSTR